MKFTGVILVILGILIFQFPDIIQYTLAGILVFAGANILLAGTLFGQKDKNSFRVGEYEIFRNKK